MALFLARSMPSAERTLEMRLNWHALSCLFQCHFCPKTFVNNSFLQSHMRRRHQGEQEAALTLVGFKRTHYYILHRIIIGLCTATVV